MPYAVIPVLEKRLNLRATLEKKEAIENAKYVVISTPTNYDDSTQYLFLIPSINPTGIVDLTTIIASLFMFITSLTAASTEEVSK